MTDKRFTIIYGVDENPFEWDIMDNEKDTLICQCNGKPICDLLNELHNKYIDEYALRETLQLELQRIEEENEQLRKENIELKFIIQQDEFAKKEGFKW